MFVCLCLSLCLSDTNQLLSLSDRGWGKNVGFKHRCQAWRGMGGRFSPYSSMCRKTDPLLPRAQSASLPYVRLIDVQCLTIRLHWNSDFEYWSFSIWKYFGFHPCTKHHTPDGCIGLNIRLNPNNVHWTPFIQIWFLPFWHYWKELEFVSAVSAGGSVKFLLAV